MYTYQRLADVYVETRLPMADQYTVDVRGKHVVTVGTVVREASIEENKICFGDSRPTLIVLACQQMEADGERK